MPRFFSSLRSRLILFVLLASLPALALTLMSGMEQRQQAAQAAQNDAMRLVRLAANNQDQLIENTRGFLIALSHSLASGDNILSTCSQMFSHMLYEHFEHFSAFYVADLEGNIVCTMPQGDTPDHLLDCPHYNKLINSQDFVISKYHICQNTGRAVISMGYPINRDTDGDLEGVINVSLDLSWFNRIAAEAQLPPGSTLTVLDKEGAILAYYPDPEQWLGETMPAGSIADIIYSQIEGVAEGTGTDGVRRLYGFMPLSGTDESVFVTIGIPSNLAYAEADRMLIRNLILLGGATLLALVAAWLLSEALVIHQTRSLVETTRRLASGDLDARTQVPYREGELGQLAQAFDVMAQALKDHERERDLAEAAIQAYAEDLERSNRDLRDFANIASHDLQEPLRKIQTFSDLLHHRYLEQLDERGRDYLARMADAAGRMGQLITDLLAYSRIDSKSQPFERVDLGEIAQQVLRDLDMQIEQNDASISIGVLPTVEADPIQMRQLFQNLVSNAIKFHKPNSQPAIEIKQIPNRNDPANPANTGEAGYVRIEVRDNGIGFETKYAERIFHPFERLHPRDRYTGTGMGLAICRKIVERHHGGLTAESETDVGSTFIIRLPLHQSEAKKEQNANR